MRISAHQRRRHPRPRPEGSEEIGGRCPTTSVWWRRSSTRPAYRIQLVDKRSICGCARRTGVIAVRGTNDRLVIMASDISLGATMPDWCCQERQQGLGTSPRMLSIPAQSPARWNAPFSEFRRSASPEFSMETLNAPLWETAMKCRTAQILRKVTTRSCRQTRESMFKLPGLRARRR